MRQLFKEPLVHFLLLGTLLFLLYSFLNKEGESAEDYTIHLGQSDIQRLTKAYEKNWSILPDSATLQSLIQEEINTEILYREALRMNLDHNDEIIRRRLKQKYEFLVKDLVSLEKPSAQALQTFHQEHPELYQQDKTLSFSQIYFSPDKRKTPKVDAHSFYEQVKGQPEPNTMRQLGDNFHLPTYFAQKDPDAIRQAFGKQFADALFKANEKGWLPPIPSGYGFHVVWIHQISTASLIPYERIEEKVFLDWQQQQQAIYNERLQKNLLEKYEVVVEK